MRVLMTLGSPPSSAARWAGAGLEQHPWSGFVAALLVYAALAGLGMVFPPAAGADRAEAVATVVVADVEPEPADDEAPADAAWAVLEGDGDAAGRAEPADEEMLEICADAETAGAPADAAGLAADDGRGPPAHARRGGRADGAGPGDEPPGGQP